MSGKPVIRWSVSRLEALPGDKSSPSISPGPQWAGANILNRPPSMFICMLLLCIAAHFGYASSPKISFFSGYHDEKVNFGTKVVETKACV